MLSRIVLTIYILLATTSTKVFADEVDDWFADNDATRSKPSIDAEAALVRLEKKQRHTHDSQDMAARKKLEAEQVTAEARTTILAARKRLKELHELELIAINEIKSANTSILNAKKESKKITTELEAEQRRIEVILAHADSQVKKRDDMEIRLMRIKTVIEKLKEIK